MIKLLKIFSLFFFMIAGSACSVSSLRCGVEDDRSYVDLVNVPQDIAGQARYYADLCAFAYDKGDE